MFVFRLPPIPRIIVKSLLFVTCAWLSVESAFGAAAPWTDLGVYGGNVLSLAIDPRNPATMFAGTYMGAGLFISRDGGASWEAVTTANRLQGEDAFADHAVQAVAIAPSDSSVVWVAHNAFLAKSSDGGSTWTHIPNAAVQVACRDCSGDAGDGFRYGMALAIHPGNPDIVYVSTSGPMGSPVSGAVYKTVDGGASWAKLNQGGDFDFAVDDVALDPVNPTVVWAVTNSNGYNNIWDGTVYRSADGGETWTRVSPQYAIGGILTVAPKPDDPDTVFVAGGYGLVQLTRNGDQWDLSYPVGGCLMASDAVFAPSDPNTLYAAWMVPADGYWGGDGLPKLTRGTFDGTAWHWQTQVVDTRIARQFYTLAVHPTDPQVVYGGDSGLGIGRSADAGASWSAVNQGLEAVIVYDVDVDNADTRHMIAASASGLYERPAGSPQWIRRHTGFFRSVRFRPDNGSTYYAGMSGYLARTDDNGATWRYSAWLNYANVEDIAVDPVDNGKLFIATGLYGQQVLRSTDGGANFTAVLDGVNQAGQGYRMNTLAIDPAESSHILAGGGNFASPYVAGDLWESRDGGDTWARTGLTDTVVNAVLIDPRDARILYAGCGFSQNYVEPVWKSTDGGQTWTRTSIGLPPARRTLFSIWAPDRDHLFAVGRYGFATMYNGHVWEVHDSTSGDTLYGVFGTSAADLFAVGAYGTILHYDGRQWRPQASGTDRTLYKVWAAAPTDAYAVGQDGVILHYDGAVWSPMTSPTANTLYEIRGASGHDIFAAGTGGTLLHYDGLSWQPMVSGVSPALNALWVAAAGDVFAAGDDGVILHFNGNDWQVMQSPTTDALYGLWGSSPSDMYAAGPGGRVLHFDGRQWSQIDLNAGNGYQEIWGTADDRVFFSDLLGGVWVWDGDGLEALRRQGTYDRSVTDLAFHRHNPDILYAATYKAGVFISPDQAGNWLDLGAPPSMTYALSAGSLYAATGAGVYQCTGTGVVAGRIRDIDNLTELTDAVVSSDLGLRCTSYNGRYMMVLPAGIFDLYAVSAGYQVGTASGLSVYGSDVTWQNFDMIPGDPVAPAEAANADYSRTSGNVSGGSYCFIGTLTD